MKATQNDRVLRALRTVGVVGITQGDFLGPTMDDGPRITRVGARIKDLKDAGYTISTAGTRDGFTVYVIAERVPAPNDRHSPPDIAEQLSLEVPAAPVARSNAYTQDLSR